MFKDGDTIFIEPFRAKAFPVIKDLVWTEAHLIEFNKQVVSFRSIPQIYRCKCDSIPKHDADRAFDAATCIGCGACVASCKNFCDAICFG
jgi:succinate dehydrogenase / fumarate reductase iron-sulfur subunit